jgi:hypothetical protein
MRFQLADIPKNGEPVSLYWFCICSGPASELQRVVFVSTALCLLNRILFADFLQF